MKHAVSGADTCGLPTVFGSPGSKHAGTNSAVWKTGFVARRLLLTLGAAANALPRKQCARGFAPNRPFLGKQPTSVRNRALAAAAAHGGGGVARRESRTLGRSRCGTARRQPSVVARDDSDARLASSPTPAHLGCEHTLLRGREMSASPAEVSVRSTAQRKSYCQNARCLQLHNSVG
ncbi:hypothetical protein MTO96_004712 [Rhipicephalus appendiculatus]